jgi:hypothetical protein
MVQKIAVAVGRGFEFSEKLSQHAVMVGVRFGEPIHLGADVGMVREVMKSVANARGREGGRC